MMDSQHATYYIRRAVTLWWDGSVSKRALFWTTSPPPKPTDNGVHHRPVLGPLANHPTTAERSVG